MENSNREWEGKITYTKTPPGEPGPELACDSFVAVAVQSPIYGCRNKEDVNKNLDNVCRLVGDSIFNPAGVGEVKLVSLAEGSLQGMWDEQSDMDQATYCKEVALTIPGPEVDRLAEVARNCGIYLVAQAKIREPDLMPDRYFNQGFIISPEGEVILRHTKNVLHVCEQTASPYDIWDVWSEKVGTDLELHYPVVKTDIGNLAVVICYETMFPETFRALTVMGAEVITRMSNPNPYIVDGTWEVFGRAAAWQNDCYIVMPNLGPYYTNPDVPEPYDLGGGNSMIIDYQGHVVRKTVSANAAYVPGEINIKKLREWRASGLTTLVQVRADLWKQIYEKWPDYPRNLYLKQDVNRAVDRMKIKQDIAEKFIDVGLFTSA
jgi:predicted amidohydrolase